MYFCWYSWELLKRSIRHTTPLYQAHSFTQISRKSATWTHTTLQTWDMLLYTKKRNKIMSIWYSINLLSWVLFLPVGFTQGKVIYPFRTYNESILINTRKNINELFRSLVNTRNFHEIKPTHHKLFFSFIGKFIKKRSVRRKTRIAN